ncbi:MAG: mandelate racemase/muconate lactonizing enzyme family protein [Saprospiraceae bacterium]
MKRPLIFDCKGIFLPLRTTFEQASSVRNMGESIWCEVRREDKIGLGEGCPRIYVTNETVENSLDWIKQKLSIIQNECQSLDSLKFWMNENRDEIDQYPAAFCAIETALLDLFSKEKNISVEQLLGFEKPERVYTYTGVLSDGGEEKFIAHATRFLQTGFTDFKIKVNGNLKIDQNKFELLFDLAKKINISNLRIRLDANNLWKGKLEEAIAYLKLLDFPILGIEEPVAPKNYQALSQISNELNVPIILDESLCSLFDFKKLDQVSGKFIGNLKVSRLGGIIRTLEIIKALKKRNHRIIIGAHVGETSILTRAGMCAAQAAGESLVAQEGGFGEILLEKDMVKPSLSFGNLGQIDLSKFQNTWNKGWGF